MHQVAAKLQEAANQARRYGAALRERYELTDLWLFAVAGLGVERVVWRAVKRLDENLLPGLVKFAFRPGMA